MSGKNGRIKRNAEPPIENGTATALAEPPISAEAIEVPPEVPVEANGEVKNRPVKTISVPVGNGVWVRAAIWPKELTLEGRVVTVFSVTVEKSYPKDGRDAYTGFFRGSELHLVQYVLTAASQWILDQRREEVPPF